MDSKKYIRRIIERPRRKAIALLALSALLILAALPQSSAHIVAPPNRIVDHGFELYGQGVAAWTPSASPPGTSNDTCELHSNLNLLAAAVDGVSLMALNNEVSSFVFQRFAPSPGSSLVLEFCAKREGSTSLAGPNALEIGTNWDPDTGAFNRVGAVIFAGADLQVWAYDEYEFIDAPLDGEWHLYRLLLSSQDLLGVLLIDGTVAATIQSGADAAFLADTIIVGDVANDGVDRPASPDVFYDEVYFGELL